MISRVKSWLSAGPERATRARHAALLAATFLLPLLPLTGAYQVADAQIRERRFVNLTPDQGLSHFRVYDILQDRDGFLWIATMDGLNRYDGYEFTVFRHDEHDSTSLSDNVVVALCQDTLGNIWVGTGDGVLHKFDSTTEKLQRLAPDQSTPGIWKHRIRTLYIDPFGSLWVCSFGGGLSKLVSVDTTAHAKFITFSHDSLQPESLSSDNVYSAFMDRAGALWVGTDNGLNVLLPGQSKFMHYKTDPTNPQSLSSNLVISLAEDRSGALWVGTGGGGLDLLDRGTGKFSHHRPSPLSTSLSHHTVSSIHVQDERYIWIGTQVGLNKFDKSTEEFTRYFQDQLDPNSLVNDYVVKVMSDRSGNLWVATDRGLSKLTKRTEQLAYYRHEEDRSAPQSVTSLLEDSKGRLWIGTKLGLKRIVQESGATVRHGSGPTLVGLRGLCVQAIHEDKNGTIWVGVLQGGLNRFDEASGGFEHIRWNEQLSKCSIMSICEDHSGKLWLGTFADGLLVYDPKGNRLQQYSHDPNLPGSLSSNIVPVVLVDRGGVLWVGTEGGGLNRTAVRDVLRFEHHRHDPKDPHSISDDRIHALFEDFDGSIWIATDGGLDRYDRRKERLSRALPQHDQYRGTILGILEDGRGMLWLGTIQNGLYHFDPKSGELEHYDVNDGLQSNRFYFACSKRKEGEMLFGGENGFNRFHPDSIRRNERGPTVVLTDVRLFERPLTEIGSLRGLREVRLPHDQNYLTFEFSALDFTMPSRNTYAYKMDGLDPAWVQSGKLRVAHYTNIEPGEYVFRVRGSNSDGVWANAELLLNVIIDPPFWRTWWFETLAAITVVVVIISIHKYRLSKAVALERLRLQIASDLHDDVGSSLGSIALTSDYIQGETGVPTAAKTHLAEISNVARKTAETLRDMVWVIRPKHDHMASLIEKLRHDAAFMLHGVEYEFKIIQERADAALDMEFRHNVILMFKEVLHNVLRHARAHSVEIHIEVGECEFRMSICDDGVGFDPDRDSTGNGLRNLRKRAEELGGRIRIRSANQAGTEVSFIAKIPRSRYLMERIPIVSSRERSKKTKRSQLSHARHN